MHKLGEESSRTGFVDASEKVDTMSRMSTRSRPAVSAGSSLMSSKRGPCGWSSTRERRSARARDVDLTPSVLADWVRKAHANRTKGRTGLTGVKREELARLRRDVNQRLDCRVACRVRRLGPPTPGVVAAA